MVEGEVFYLYACTSEEVYAVGESVFTRVDYAFDASLDYEFGAFDAGGVGDVEGGPV